MSTTDALAEANRRLHELAHDAGSLLFAARVRAQAVPHGRPNSDALERLRLSYELLQRVAKGSDLTLETALNAVDQLDRA